MLESKSEIQLSLEVSWKKERNEFEIWFLIIKLHKDGSLRAKDRRFNLKVTGIIWENYFKVNSEKFYEVRLFLKQSDYREEIDVMEEMKWTERIHSIRQVSQNGSI